MSVPSNIFREYDLRGNADTELTNENVLAVSRAYGAFLRQNGVSRATVGGDVRLSTERIRAAVIQGLLESGICVIDLGVVTTPMLYWSFFKYSCDGGIMVTGSHNPKNMNGLKLGFRKATLYGADIQHIREMTQAGVFEPADAPGSLAKVNIENEYLDMLTSKIQLPRPMKIVIDPANGTAALFAGKYFKRLGCDVTAIYDTPDGNFPNHHPDPQKKENMTDLAAKVLETGADVGFGFDGDADRIGVVDNKGRIVGGDILMALFWREILPKYPGAQAIIEVKCSKALEDEILRLGGRPYYYKAGHSLIKAEMKRIGAPFAGEYSGHMFFADEYYGYDDSFYAAGRLLRMLGRGTQTLAELYDTIPVYYHTEEMRIPCPDDKKFEVMKQITADALKDHKAITVDGVRILYDGGWGLIRASNTQPVLAVRCEGSTPEKRDEICEDIWQRMLKAGLPDFQWKI